MIIVTTETIVGKKIKETLGIVKGSVSKAKWFGSDIGAFLKNIIGGELKGYTELLNSARDDALQRMVVEAKKMKADAVVAVRFGTSNIAQGASEVIAYGTAVKLK